MIKKLIDKLLGKPAAAASKKTPLGKRVEIPAEVHGIDPELLDERAVKVVRTLTDAGFEAYIVGGAVRDLLLGMRPKDFDVATNATPEQVKGLFRRAFIIGRRFRIVHVVYGRGREHEVIEVSTFRALPTESEAVNGNEKTAKGELDGKAHAVDASGRVLRDNVWGPQIEDAARRDFTVNAMYYDPQRRLVVDYHGGLADARAKLLRMIGDPDTRYREDPVRIIRAARFAAKLGFELEKKTLAPVQACIPLLANVPASRLFDEMIKLLQTGHSLASLVQLKKLGLVGQGGKVFAVLDAMLTATGDLPEGVRGKFVRQAFEDTDRRVNEGRGVSPSFMLACMLWHEVLDRWTAARNGGEPPVPALAQSIDAVFDARIGDISGRGKLAADMREIWMMQTRFERRSGSGVFSLIEQPRYRAGFDFLRLRADVGEIDAALADWWEDFALGSDDDRQALLADARAAQQKAPRVVRAPRPEAPQAAANPENTSDDTTAPARKRRRRRRKPAGGGEGAVASAPGNE
jgi:poly(A) polymerase